jgi:retron-type reverse transcriptase
MSQWPRVADAWTSFPAVDLTISIPSLEDKIVQKTAADLVNAIYEQDFLDCSYGFRPGRGPQDALDEVGRVLCRRPISREQLA